jgi:hypothetical protein
MIFVSERVYFCERWIWLDKATVQEDDKMREHKISSKRSLTCIAFEIFLKFREHSWESDHAYLLNTVQESSESVFYYTAEYKNNRNSFSFLRKVRIAFCVAYKEVKNFETYALFLSKPTLLCASYSLDCFLKRSRAERGKLRKPVTDEWL